MKLTILQENLSNAVSIASRFANAKAQLPILGNILLSTRKTKLYVSSTNLETSVSCRIAAKVDKEGEIAVPSKVVNEIITNLSPGILNLEAEKEQLKILKDEFKSSVLGMNTSDFPKIPDSIGKDNLFSLPNEDFLKALSLTLFATSVDETRPVLTGILLIFEKGNLNLVATDGFRLSYKKLRIGKSDASLKVVLPRNVLLEFSHLVGESQSFDFSFKESENQVLFSLDSPELILSSRIIEGEFPDFEKIIPKSSSYKVNTDKEELIRAVKLASVFARDSANIVKIRLNKNSIILLSESQTSGSQEIKVEAACEGVRKDAELEIAFNFRFLEEFLNASSSEDVKIELNDASSPGIFLDTKDPEFLHLIMPVRIQS